MDALFRIPAGELDTRVTAALARFDLAAVADALPPALPLGMRQRLQLAAACLHRPEVLILDEPTSGVDPAARDRFWRLLVEMSRRDGVTIFISTHFMNEAERCDRISLMHAGRVLAVGSPDELRQSHGRPRVSKMPSSPISRRQRHRRHRIQQCDVPSSMAEVERKRRFGYLQVRRRHLVSTFAHIGRRSRLSGGPGHLRDAKPWRC